MNHPDLRRRAAVVRELPLETVLLARGAVPDRHDRCKWHTEQGPLSITDTQFMNWHHQRGGGGAIDLVMHLAAIDFRAAVVWLEHCLAAGPLTARTATPRGAAPESPATSPGRPLRLPVRDERRLSQVRHYLIDQRHLAAALLEPLLESGRIYADPRGNAVFLLVAGKDQRPVGAELRGTGPRVWRGLASGTRKDDGYFWIGTPGGRELVLCESAIDAISCLQLYPWRICLSTAGVRVRPRWLPGLIARGYQIHCGFDADEPGDGAAAHLIALHPVVQRLRPPAHDWNDALTLHE